MTRNSYWGEEGRGKTLSTQRSQPSLLLNTPALVGIRDRPKFTRYPGLGFGKFDGWKKNTSHPISQAKNCACSHFFSLKKCPSPHIWDFKQSIGLWKTSRPPLLPPSEQPRIDSIQGSLVISKSLFSLFDNGIDCRGSELLSKSDPLQNLTSKKSCSAPFW